MTMRRCIVVMMAGLGLGACVEDAPLEPPSQPVGVLSGTLTLDPQTTPPGPMVIGRCAAPGDLGPLSTCTSAFRGFYTATYSVGLERAFVIARFLRDDGQECLFQVATAAGSLVAGTPLRLTGTSSTMTGDPAEPAFPNGRRPPLCLPPFRTTTLRLQLHDSAPLPTAGSTAGPPLIVRDLDMTYEWNP